MRILEVLEPSGGGSGRHFVDLCAGLKARGNTVTAVYSPVRAEARFVRELMGLDLAEVVALPMLRAVGPRISPPGTPSRGSSASRVPSTSITDTVPRPER